MALKSNISNVEVCRLNDISHYVIDDEKKTVSKPELNAENVG